MSEYFLNKPQETFGQAVLTKISKFKDFVRRSGVERAWDSTWIQYHAHEDGFNRKIRITGVDGELVKININQLRSIIQSILSMTTSTRPAAIPKAINDDAQSLVQAALAEGLIDYFFKDKNIEEKTQSAAEAALVLGSGYVYLNWNPWKGDIESANQDPITGEFTDVKMTGDIDCFNPSIKEVYFDPAVKKWQENQWVIVYRTYNKYELEKLFPEYAETIRNLKTKQNRDYMDTSERVFYFSQESDELIGIFEFYHKKTLLKPLGLKALILENGTCIHMEDYAEDVLPVFRLSPKDFINSQIGYATAFDLQGLQNAYDQIYSTMLTNINMFGLQSLQVPVGTELTRSDIGGPSMFEVPEGTDGVKAVDLLADLGPLINALNITEDQMETTSGQNSVSRGNIEASQRSGAALALVQSMAVQYNSSFQQNYGRLIEDTATHLFRLLKKNAKSKKTLSILGKDNSSKTIDFTGDMISAIDRVVVDLGNPLMKTVAGRKEIGLEMIQNGLIKTPEEYITLITTGQLKPLYKSVQSTLERIHKENDMFLDGVMPDINMLDDHRLHLQEHQVLLNNEAVRSNPEISQMVWDHMQEHLAQWAFMSNDPKLANLLLALGQQPLQGPVPMMGPDGQPMTDAADLSAPEGLTPGGAARMPKNPLTGEETDVNTGLPETE